MSDNSVVKTSKERVQTADIEACRAWLIQSRTSVFGSHQIIAMLDELLERRRTPETREGLCDCRDTTVDKIDGIYLCRQCKRPIRCAENTQKANA